MNLCAKFSANSYDLPEIQAFFLISLLTKVKTIINQSKNIISVQSQGLLTGIALIRPATQKKNPIYDEFLPKYAKSLFHIQNEQDGTLQFVKRVPKSKFSVLTDHSLVFTQIFSKLNYTQNEKKIKPILETSTF